MAAEREFSDVALQFRAAMSQLATGVVLVTTHLDGQPWGTTVSACCSVSMDPPMLLVSLARGCATEQAVAQEKAFGVSILDDALLEVAKLGAAPGKPKFIADICTEGVEGDTRPPSVAGAPVHVDCELDRRVDAGDHVLLLGLVRAVTVTGSERPLLYFARQFRTLHDATWNEQARLEGPMGVMGAGYHW